MVQTFFVHVETTNLIPIPVLIFLISNVVVKIYNSNQSVASCLRISTAWMHIHNFSKQQTFICSSNIVTKYLWLLFVILLSFCILKNTTVLKSPCNNVYYVMFTTKSNYVAFYSSFTWTLKNLHFGTQGKIIPDIF